MDYHSNYIPQCCGWCGLQDKTRKNLKNFKWSRNKKFFDELYDPNLQSSCEKPHLFCYSCRTQLFKQLNNAQTENAKVEAKEDMKKKLHIFEDHVFSGCFICLQFEDQPTQDSVQNVHHPTQPQPQSDQNIPQTIDYHLQALQKTCCLCGKFETQNLRKFYFERNQDKFNMVCKPNNDSIFPKPPPLYCYACRNGYLKPLSDAREHRKIDSCLEQIEERLYIFKQHFSNGECMPCNQYYEGMKSVTDESISMEHVSLDSDLEDSLLENPESKFESLDLSTDCEDNINPRNTKQIHNKEFIHQEHNYEMQNIMLTPDRRPHTDSETEGDPTPTRCCL